MDKDKSYQSKNATGVYDPIRAQAIKWTAKDQKCSDQYVRAIINGTSKGGRSEEIKKAFLKKSEELKAVLK